MSGCVALMFSFVGASHNAVAAQDAPVQAERITIRTVPAAGQVVVMRATHDLTMNVEGPSGLPISGTIEGKTNLAGTMKVGAPNAQGHTDAQYTIDSLSVESTFNGAPLPIGNVGRNAIGQTFSITFDSDDNVVDVQSSNAMLRSLLSAGFTGLSKVALAIGESTTVHNEMPIPLPAATSLNATLESTITLQSVTTEPAGRIAHLAIASSGGMEPNSGSPLPMTVTISGSGTMDVNLDAGYVVRHETTATFDAVAQPPTSPSDGPQSPIKIHGSMKMRGEAEASR